jgi:hypothetical protein
VDFCWSLYEDQTKQREINGLMDAMTAYQLQEGFILTEDESDRFWEECNHKIV